MAKYNVLVVCGGDGSEHGVSVVSADFVEQQLRNCPDFEVLRATLHERRFLLADGGELSFSGNVASGAGEPFKVDCVVPVIHGHPGETGDFQSFLSILGIPYIGCNSESSRYCFNKITTKLYLSAYGIPNTPYVMVPAPTKGCRETAFAFFHRHHDVYVKAASQGSSVGCYHVTAEDALWPAIEKAFTLSSEVLIEQTIPHRELEVAAYEYGGEVVLTEPGEIIMPDGAFYDFDEKYSKDSKTVTTVEPEGLSAATRALIHDLAGKTFSALKLRDLSRIDFFLAPDGNVLVNEINTFPGMTPISMFPKLLEHHGHRIGDFFREAVLRAIKRGA
ncbi:MAG: D-alanine--D-alanine ligase [Succinivibrionaceae bacterium]|nr:D-alanine--D-alanine ligase [Succinivibrionaceae bacterium]